MFIFIFASVITYDIWFFVTHYVLHKNILAINHKIHHNVDVQCMTFKDAYICDYIEGPFQSLGCMFPLFFSFDLVGFSIAIVIINIRALLRHDMKYQSYIGNHHILHHKYPQYNFGEYWIDVLCGTDYANKAEYVYGVFYT